MQTFFGSVGPFLFMLLISALVFGLVIFVHELGHFAVAKWSGIKVNEFALGMGPAIFKRKKGETTYALRLFPIGGFVSMEGEDEASDDSRSFQKAPVYKRLLVIVAGAFMNILLGFIAAVVLVTAGGTIRTRTVAGFAPDATTQASGLKVGDTILRVNGRFCFTVDDVSYEISRINNEKVDLVVRRNGETVHLPQVHFTIVDGVDEATGTTYRALVPDFYIEGKPLTFFSVISEAFRTTLSYTRLIYISLVDLVTGRVPLDQLSGPVGIVSGIGQAISIGWEQVVRIMAIITINLGVVNMLPLPALDGGKAVLLIIEGIRRKPMNPKYETIINVAGFSLLILLMVFVSFNDIRKLIF